MTDYDKTTTMHKALTRLARHGWLTEAQVRDRMERYLRSHEPPRNSGEGTAVDGPMPLAGGDESLTHEPA